MLYQLYAHLLVLVRRLPDSVIQAHNLVIELSARRLGPEQRLLEPIGALLHVSFLDRFLL